MEAVSECPERSEEDEGHPQEMSFREEYSERRRVLMEEDPERNSMNIGEVHCEINFTGDSNPDTGDFVDVKDGYIAQAHFSDLALPPVQREVQNTEDLAFLFEKCIGEVGDLERKRDALVQELLQLEQPMLQAVQEMRLQLTKTRSELSCTQLEKQRLQEEMSQVKRKLFAMVRDCIQTQVTMAAQQYEVAQLVLTQEELQSQVLDLIQETSHIREAHRNHLVALEEGLRSRRRPRAMSDLSHCRRASMEFGRYARSSMRSVEQWYEPRVMALLRRRQVGEEALRRTRELGQDLRTRLKPLKDESQKLELQKTCLEQRLALMEEQRRETMAQYKEAVFSLEESMRELKTELQVQINVNRQLEELRSMLLTQLDFYRRTVVDQDGSRTRTEE
ncbi:syncoilin-like [Chanos chanos]|uniref:Syncoilin-like n=1 Tax=Chanos chanos TaxID=29144 RepID=A0A6J2V7A8_CHACN|nr:syncoilin-like [Chanos chanos]